MAAALGLETDASAAQEDWSASLLMPYLAHYFPDARVVTVLLSRGAGEAQVLALAGCLAETAGTRGLLVLGSADFSHYQDVETARDCDKETARAIEDGDRTRLLSLGNEYLDSPETVAVLLIRVAAGARAKRGGRHVRDLYSGRAAHGGFYYAYAVK